MSTTKAVGSCIEHEVQRGDWLYDIGRRHNVDLRTLLIANPNLRNPDSLRVGSRITIPRDNNYIPSTKSWSSPARIKLNPVCKEPSRTQAFVSFLRPEMLTLSKTFVLLGQFLSNKNREHKVLEGDSLEWLAAKYGTTVKALKKLNNMKDDIIYSGSVLKIDRRSADQTLFGRKASVQERNALIEGSGSTHQPLKLVKPVLKACLRPQTLQTSNTIPKLQTVRVEYGDTLADIASGHGLSPEELQRLNNLRNENIFEGDVLAVSPGPSAREIPELRSGRRRTNRILFSRQCAGPQRRLGVGGPEQSLKSQLTTGNLKLEGLIQWHHAKMLLSLGCKQLFVISR